MLKGWLAVVGLAYLSSYPAGSSEKIHLEVALACAAIVGHILPIYVGFKGGKGVATGLGIIFAFSPIVGLLCIVVFGLVFFAFHYVSLASMIGAVSFPIWMALVAKMHYGLVIAFSIVLPAIVIFMHRKNIMRLISGQESKIQLFKKTGSNN